MLELEICHSNTSAAYACWQPPRFPNPSLRSKGRRTYTQCSTSNTTTRVVVLFHLTTFLLSYCVESCDNLPEAVIGASQEHKPPTTARTCLQLHPPHPFISRPNSMPGLDQPPVAGILAAFGMFPTSLNGSITSGRTWTALSY